MSHVRGRDTSRFEESLAEVDPRWLAFGEIPSS